MATEKFERWLGDFSSKYPDLLWRAGIGGASEPKPTGPWHAPAVGDDDEIRRRIGKIIATSSPVFVRGDFEGPEFEQPSLNLRAGTALDGAYRGTGTILKELARFLNALARVDALLHRDGPLPPKELSEAIESAFVFRLNLIVIGAQHLIAPSVDEALLGLLAYFQKAPTS